MEGAKFTVRRRVTISIVVWSCLILTYLAIFGTDSSVQETIALTVGGLCSTALLWYTGATAYDDVDVRKRHADEQAFRQFPTTGDDPQPHRFTKGNRQQADSGSAGKPSPLD